MKLLLFFKKWPFFPTFRVPQCPQLFLKKVKNWAFFGPIGKKRAKKGSKFDPFWPPFWQLWGPFSTQSDGLVQIGPKRCREKPRVQKKSVFWQKLSKFFKKIKILTQKNIFYFLLLFIFSKKDSLTRVKLKR